MKKKHLLSKAGQTSLLPQYISSNHIYEKFSDATLEGLDEIRFAENITGEIKLIDQEESYDDRFVFFEKNKAQMEDEFFKQTSLRIGKDKTEEFCTLISDLWYDGKLKRTKGPMENLFASVKNYLLESRKATNASRIKVHNDVINIAPSFTHDEIQDILQVNREMMYNYINEWISSHPEGSSFGTDDVYCRRGLLVTNDFENDDYKEWNYINSYSMAVTVPEKFAQISKGLTPAIVHTKIGNLDGRILFFSPFIKGMPAGQLELGVIPHCWQMELISDGIHRGFHEYRLE